MATSTTPDVPRPPVASVEDAERAKEEQRLASLAAEFRLLSQEDQQFIGRHRMTIRAKPSRARANWDHDDVLDGLHRLSRFFNRVDLVVYYHALADAFGAARIIEAVRMPADLHREFRLAFGMQHIELKEALAGVAERIANWGLKSVDDDGRAVLRKFGPKFFANAKD